MLDVIRGPFAKLEERLLDQLVAKPRWQPALVVARSSRLIRRLQRQLAQRATVLNVRLATLEMLTRDLAEPADRAPIDDDILTQRLVLELIDRFFAAKKFLGSAVRSPKTAIALHAAVMDLKEACVPPSRLAEVLREPSFIERDKLAELFQLYELYEAALAELRLWDSADLLTLAAQRVERLPDDVILYGYYDMNQSQLDFFRAVCGTKHVTMYFPYAPSMALAKRFYETHVAGLAGSSTSLEGGSELARSLFSDQIQPVDAHVRIVSAAGTYDEVWAVAKEILRSGLPFDRIGVIARSLEPYAEVIDQVFREHAIPFTCSARRSLRGSPLARAVELALTAADADYERTSVVELLTGGFVRLPEGSDPALWDLATSRLGIGRGERRWRERLERALAAGGVQDISVTAEQIQRLLQAFDALTCVRLPDQGSWTELSTRCLERLAELLEGPLGAVGEAIRTLAKLDRVSLRPVTRADFVETLLTRLDQSTEPLGFDNVAGVQVVDAMAARGLAFDAVFVLGMNEKVFPRFITEDPFLKDHNRATLRAILGAKLDPKIQGYDEERLLFLLAIESAPSVTLMLQRADDNGRLLAPSTFLREVVYRLPAAQGKTFEEYLRAHAQLVPRMPTERVERVELEFLPPHELYMRGLRATEPPWIAELESAAHLGEYDGAIGAEFQTFWRSYSQRVSPTAVERYAACPMQFFLARGLGLEPFDRPEETDEATPLDLGNLAHEILRRLYSSGGTLEQIWREETARFEREAFVRYPLLWEVQSRRVLETIQRFLAEFDAKVVGSGSVVYTEQSADPLPIAGVAFTGRMDRVVVTDRTVRVDDYKWKDREDDPCKSALACRRIQLPIYMKLAAALAESKRHAFDEIRASLLLIRAFTAPRTLEEALGERPVHVEVPLPSDFWESDGTAFEANLSRVLTLMGDGFFFVNPGDACKHCDFAAACRKNHLPTARRPRRDPRTKDFWDICES